MNHRERIQAVLRGEPTDRTPIALWRHFPKDDLNAESLAARVVEFQQQYELDFVKVTPASSYPAEMYGGTFRVPSPGSPRLREGTREPVTRPVNALNDWDKLTTLDVNNPVFVRELTALRLIRQQLGEDVHILQTIFSPLNSALNIAGERLYTDLRDAKRSDMVHRALRPITDTTIRFALESLRAGADAIFFATQMATSTRLTLEEFREFGESYDLQLLQAIRAAKPAFIYLHIHGLDIYFDACLAYPVDVVNWHDRRTPPSLKHAKEKWKGALSGGFDEWNVLAENSNAAVTAQARDAVAQAGERGFILAAGCVIAVDTPEENIRAAIDAVRS